MLYIILVHFPSGQHHVHQYPGVCVNKINYIDVMYTTQHVTHLQIMIQILLIQFLLTIKI